MNHTWIQIAIYLSISYTIYDVLSNYILNVLDLFCSLLLVYYLQVTEGPLLIDCEIYMSFLYILKMCHQVLILMNTDRFLWSRPLKAPMFKFFMGPITITMHQQQQSLLGRKLTVNLHSRCMMSFLFCFVLFFFCVVIFSSNCNI